MLPRLHARVPRWVHRIKRLKEAAHPIEVVFSLRADLGLHAIMNRRKARPAITSRLDVRIVRRTTAVIQQHDDRIRLREILRPVVFRIHHRKSLRIGLIDPPSQIRSPRQELMLPAAPMRALRRDEHQSFCALRGIVLTGVVEDVTRLGESGCGDESEEDVELHALAI